MMSDPKQLIVELVPEHCSIPPDIRSKHKMRTQEMVVYMLGIY